MTGFASEWLATREPVDHAARCGFAGELATFLARRERVRVLDLGAGTGSNFRYLAPRLGSRQLWTAIDNDAGLLAAIPEVLGAWNDVRLETENDALGVRGTGFSARLECLRMDLGRNLDRLEIPSGALVTAAALLDLVSGDWLEALARRCEAAGAAVLFALTYDGRMSAEPADEDDEIVRGLFNRHQSGDKGFGPALGPAAAKRTAAVFSAAGYVVESRRSDWRIGPRETALQTALIDGWHCAAAEVAQREIARLEAWRKRRERHIVAGRSKIRVGHVDVFGVPASIQNLQ